MGIEPMWPAWKAGALPLCQHRIITKIKLNWSGWRESNPHMDLGKVLGYHYITPAFQKSGGYRGNRTQPFRPYERLVLPLYYTAVSLLSTYNYSRDWENVKIKFYFLS
jgi:hypothetical protein